MKWMCAVLGTALLLLQYRLWLSDDGLPGMMQMRAAVAAQLAQNQQLSQRNREALAEVRDLKNGYAALEERARNDLGMVGANETFYQVVRPSTADVAAAGAPPARPDTTLRTASR